MSILVAEDNEISAEILQYNLRQQNYETVLVKTGQEALDMLKEHSGIRLLIADIKMPGMDGLELLKRIKESPTWKRLPVILCTSLADADHVRRAGLLGCRHYLIKPIQRATLLQKVAEALGEKASPIHDKAAIMLKFGLDDESFEKIAAASLRYLEEQITLLERKINHPTGTPIILDFNGITENAATLGAERLAKLVDRLLAEKSHSVLVSQDYLPLLEELNEVVQALKAQAGSPAAATAEVAPAAASGPEWPYPIEPGR